MEELYARVGTHLGLRGMQRELEHKNAELERTLRILQTTQAQLIHSAKLAALGVMAAGLAHEINNPLNYILAGGKSLVMAMDEIRRILDGYERVNPAAAESELARLRRHREETGFAGLLNDVGEMIANITSGAERTAEIVRGLRGFTNQNDTAKDLIDIHEVINAALVLLWHKHQDAITICKRYGDIPRIPGIPGRLDQVFVNLLGNAIDAINSHGGQGVINIETRLADRGQMRAVAVAVTDDGPGLSDAARTHLFEPFFTTKDVGAGTGLGLAISLGIVEGHGGGIEVESAPGRGATFTVFLPVT
jgi:C4-dicarboxylate-specific signal transduction histidine kinase